MAEKTFTLEVITPDRVVIRDHDVVSVVLPGTEGYFGVMANHAPFMSSLTIGEIDYRKADGDEDAIAVCNGFVEIADNKVTVLADSAETCHDINIERAEAAVHRAEERLAHHPPNIDIERAEAALKRAINRLRVARRGI